MQSQERFPLQEYGDRSILTTWTISYGQVQRQSREAACLLKLWGFLDSGEVWYELIAAASDLVAKRDVPAWLLAVAEDELAYGEAMGLLSRYSLTEGREGTDSHSMHVVLHRWCGYLAEEEERQELGCLAAGLVALSVPLQSDTEFWRKRKRIMAHSLCVSRWIEEDGGSDKERVIEASIRPGHFHSLGYLLNDEDRQRAEKMYRRALQGYEKAWGPEHTETLDTVNNLGVLYAALGRLDEAEKMYQRVLQGYEKAWGPEHTSTLDTVNNLAVLYWKLGRLDEAEKMCQRALQGNEKAWGPEHTSTLDTVNNLGALYKELGRFDEAEKMYQRALGGYEKAWGPEHTSTFDTVSNLGILYADLGRLDEAEKMYQRALQGKEKAWGPEHTSTLNTVNSLGVLYADLGRLDEAEKMLQRALQGFEKAWGPEHTSTFDTVSNLGILYADLGRLDEAEKMYQRALQGYEKAWGPEHTSTLDTVHSLGLLYADLGRLDEAEKMYERALDGYEKAISPKGPMTYVPALNNMWAFASLRESQGHVDDARHWYSQALLGYQKTFGPDHNKCEPLRNKLALLVDKVDGQSSSANTTPIAASTEDHSSRENIAESIASLTMLTWYQHRLLWKQR
jgi:tetratricopeptide (TPR) repeat protein